MYRRGNFVKVSEMISQGYAPIPESTDTLKTHDRCDP